MASPIMDRSLVLSRIRRLDEVTQAAGYWLEKENASKVKAGHRFEPKKTISFFSTTVFKECHKKDRIKIRSAVVERLSRPGQKKELTVLFLARMHDTIIKAADKQRKSLAKIAKRQIKKGAWVDHLKKAPSAVLMHRIIPFLQAPIENPPALSYVSDLCEDSRADAFTEICAETYVGRQSQAAVRFQALKMLTVSPQFINNEANILLRQVQTTLAMLARADTTTFFCFPLCSTDNERLIELLQESSKGGLKTFVELRNATIGNNGPRFNETWHAVYKNKNTPNLTEDRERCLMGTINPIICLFKEMQKMKIELAFGDLSGSRKELQERIKNEVQKGVKDELSYSNPSGSRKELLLRIKKEVQQRVKDKLTSSDPSDLRKEIQERMENELQQRVKDKLASSDLSDLRKEIPKRMKNELVAESPTIAKLPLVLLLHSLAPCLPEEDLESLKGVNKSFNHALATPFRTHPGSGSIDSLSAFFKQYKVAGFTFEREKTHAAEFLETFNAMTLKDQRTFRKLLWVAGGHKAANGKGETFSEQIIGRQHHAIGDRALLFTAYSMMASLDTLKELADRFDEEGLDDEETTTIEEEYQELPGHIKERVNKLAYVFIYGAMPPAQACCAGRVGKIPTRNGFKKRGDQVKAYALACRLLAEGNFKLLSKDARDELFSLSRTLAESHDSLDPVTVRSAYGHHIKHPKTQTLLIKAIEVLENCPGEGQNYMQCDASDKAGYARPFNPQLFANLVYAFYDFEHL
jgi:hypothetical protein